MLDITQGQRIAARAHLRLALQSYMRVQDYLADAEQAVGAEFDSTAMEAIEEAAQGIEGPGGITDELLDSMAERLIAGDL